MRSMKLTPLLRAIGLVGPAVPTYGAPAAPEVQPSPSVTSPGAWFFRIEDARGVLDADVDPNPKVKDVEPGSADTRFTSCAYSTADDTRYANVSLREALTPAGAADNRGQFERQRTPDAVELTGIGDSAYWDTPNRQVLVLLDDDLLLVSTGAKGEAVSTRRQAETVRLAALVLARLSK